jgi:hypothetical protein
MKACSVLVVHKPSYGHSFTVKTGLNYGRAHTGRRQPYALKGRILLTDISFLHQSEILPTMEIAGCDRAAYGLALNVISHAFSSRHATISSPLLVSYLICTYSHTLVIQSNVSSSQMSETSPITSSGGRSRSTPTECLIVPNSGCGGTDPSGSLDKRCAES